MAHVLVLLLQIVVVLLLVQALLSWFPAEPGTTFAKLVGLVGRLTNPILAPVRRLLPPIRAGGIAIDLSVIIVIIVAEVILLPIFRSL